MVWFGLLPVLVQHYFKPGVMEPAGWFGSPAPNICCLDLVWTCPLLFPSLTLRLFAATHSAHYNLLLPLYLPPTLPFRLGHTLAVLYLV